MKTKIFLIFFFNLLLGYTLSQSESSSEKGNKLFFNPSIHGIQIEATALIFIYEYGGQIDVDLLQSTNNVCIGFRASFEHYAMGNPGGSIMGSPFNNYNLYIRLSTTNDYFSSSALFGITDYRTSMPQYVPNERTIRGGFEIKYGKVVSLILKGSTSFKERTAFFGLGVSLDYNHFL